MKRALLAGVVMLYVAASGSALAKARDDLDMDQVHKHFKELVSEMDRVRANNLYDGKGHAAKAEDLLRQAEHEIDESIRATRRTME
jgi:hypothetical protein